MHSCEDLLEELTEANSRCRVLTLLDHSGDILSKILPVKLLHQEVPKSIIRNTAAANTLSVKVTDTFPWCNGLQMRWLFGSNQPKSDMSIDQYPARSWDKLTIA